MNTKVYYSGVIGTGDARQHTWTEYTDDEARRSVRMYSWGDRTVAQTLVFIWEPGKDNPCVWGVTDHIFLPDLGTERYRIDGVERYVVEHANPTVYNEV